MTPLTDRQRLVLMAMRGDLITRVELPAPANDIAYACGFVPGEVAAQGSTAWRSMGPAQRIIFTLTSLRKRGLVYLTRRHDGLSGSAYGLTAEGKTVRLDG